MYVVQLKKLFRLKTITSFEKSFKVKFKKLSMEDHPLESRVPHLVTKMTEEDKLRILLIIGLCIWLPALAIFVYFYIQDFMKRRKRKSGLEAIVLNSCGENLVKTNFGTKSPKTNERLLILNIKKNLNNKPKFLISVLSLYFIAKF